MVLYKSLSCRRDAGGQPRAKADIGRQTFAPNAAGPAAERADRQAPPSDDRRPLRRVSSHRLFLLPLGGEGPAAVPRGQRGTFVSHPRFLGSQKHDRQAKVANRRPAPKRGAGLAARRDRRAAAPCRAGQAGPLLRHPLQGASFKFWALRTLKMRLLSS